ncbi:hypothetical protein SCHPADRAFT_943054 [Schizopora paradoxa]|uniref:Ribosomal RNA-processing protein 8 n=1 Tax=Schizopora paradoxa TaxID=27342 RepID=A0A0H2RZE8_9AGAM|nr:hypothetical protein SCHPADRAFT_943054 [Schizopora paradoxa]
MASPSTSSNPRKRKRPGAHPNDEDKVQSAEVNIEKLMKRLDSGDTKNDSGNSKKEKRKARKQPDEEEGRQRGSRNVMSTSPAKGEAGKKKKQKRKMDRSVIADGEGISSGDDGVLSADGDERQREERASTHASRTAIKPSKPSTPKRSEKTLKSDKKSEKTPGSTQTEAQSASDTKLTALQSKMRQTLDGARFRFINETLYKSSSKDAERLMRDDPKIFEDYHAGFRQQVTSWPTNPVDHFKEVIASSCPARSVIVDLGCGDAALARQLIPRGFTVLSYDLVSTNPFVVATDMCETLPLPGAEDDDVEDSIPSQVVDVVVCSLSLMSTNWLNSVREARRVLKQGGELKIAEVTSRFTDVDSFVSAISSVGFKLISKDERNTHFTLFEFKKIKRKHLDDKQWKSILSRGSVLQACEYKRR